MNNLQAAIQGLEFKPDVPLITPKEFSNRANVPYETVRTWIKNGLLPVVQLGTEKKRDMVNLLELFNICQREAMSCSK